MRRIVSRVGATEPGACPTVLIVLLLFVSAVSANAVEINPVVSAQLLGGQYFYDGNDNSFGGLASLVASPYTKFNDQWSLVPLYSGQYKGTQQVQDLIGGGTLFQDSQDHDFSTKVIRSFDNGLKLKAIGSYGIEWLRETKDESWTRGLYDNRKASGGTEAGEMVVGAGSFCPPGVRLLFSGALFPIISRSSRRK